jgi:hypothetical protein
LKALAEFILRGRLQALTVALLGSFFPFIGPSAVALVSLVKGVIDGFWVFMWVSLPLLLLHFQSTDNPLLIAVSIASMGVMVFAGQVHKMLASWQWTIVVTLAVASVVALGFGLLMAHSVDNLISQITTALAEFGAVTDNNVQQLVITKSSLLGAIAMMLSVGCIISLMIARWWQALVFNPGGFQDEFHQFAIETRAAAFLVGVILLGFVLPREYQLWITLPAIPLLLAGLALIHHTVKLLQLGGHWLVIMYLGLLLLGAPLAVFLMGLAIGDSFLDLRKKLLEYRNRKH